MNRLLRVFSWGACYPPKMSLSVLDWRTRIFGDQMKKVSDKFWGLQSRNGKGMKWSIRPRRRVGWGICKRLNAPPIKYSFLNNVGYMETSNSSKWFKFYTLNIIKTLLQTFAELSLFPTMSTLSQQGVVKRSNTHVYSTD